MAARTLPITHFSLQSRKVAQMFKVLSVATLIALASIGANAMLTPAARSADTPSPYRISKSISLGAPERWDYLSFEPESNRIFVTHGDRIDVIDASSEKIVGQVAVDGANGAAVVPAIGKGYAGSRVGKSVLVFDLNSFKVIKALPAAEDTDAIVYDPASKRVFLMQGDPHSITVVDTTTDSLVMTIHLSGQPEFAVVDGAGKLFVNIEDKREIQRVDTKTGKVDATWPIPACDSPHGLAIDKQSRRLFSSCVNSKLLVVNATTGAVVATLPIGKHTDAAAYDARTKRVFSSNGEGTLSVIQQENADQYKSLAEVPTQLGARTMTFDPKSGRIFLVTGDYTEVDPSAKDPRKRFAVKPGSTRLLLLDLVTASAN
jgi:DNA-binding beta-propeller fold protein YncE